FHPAVNLQTIAINDADQVVELVVRALHHGFPNIAFLLLTIAHDAEDGVLVVVEFAGDGHANGDTKALSQRPTGDFYARQFQPMRMSLEGRIELTQGDNVFYREISGEA